MQNERRNKMNRSNKENWKNFYWTKARKVKKKLLRKNFEAIQRLQIGADWKKQLHYIVDDRWFLKRSKTNIPFASNQKNLFINLSKKKKTFFLTEYHYFANSSGSQLQTFCNVRCGTKRINQHNWYSINFEPSTFYDTFNLIITI